MIPNHFLQLVIAKIRRLISLKQGNRPSHRSFVIAWTVALALVYSQPTSMCLSLGKVLAEEVVDDDSEAMEDDEDESDDEQFDDSERNHGRIEELVEIRSDLAKQLKRGLESRTELQACIRSIDELLTLHRQQKELLTELKTAERDGEKAKTDRVSFKIKRLRRVAEAQDHIVELQLHEIEFHERIEEAVGSKDARLRKLAGTLKAGLRRGKELANQLLQARSGDEEIDAYEVEEELEIVLDDRVHAPVQALEILAEIREAKAEDDIDLIDELREELQELEEEFDVFGLLNEEEEDRESRPTPKSKRNLASRSVLVTKGTLASYANRDLKRDVAPLLQQYCYDCHSSDTSSGELDFERLLSTSPIVKNRRKWINVIEQTKNHVMPPEDAEQPTLEERKTIVLSLHNAVFNYDYSQVRDPGYESARRLTHREYSNTVCDLFGMDIDVTGRFPVDLTATSGFDNSANSLFIQPLLMERYVGLAEHVINYALPDSPTTHAEKSVRKRVFVTRPSKTVSVSSAAEKTMRRFLLRAFRRPPSRSEVHRFSGRIVRAVANGETFEAAVKSTLRMVLVSPSFLLRTEKTEANKTQPFAVDDYDLASRLSYFLWASMPDDRLLSVAQKNELADPKVLTRQAERMIADPKSESLGTVFASQWLGSQHLGTRVRLDPIDNPWCTETLMDAMRQETSMFFNTLVRENRPITELIDADYIFVNEELARLYRMRGITGHKMRRVSVDPTKRGGIFGQGSLLAVTSFPGRTSPVVRGKWILDTVLGTPPPPPPPNVSDLSEEVASERRLSFREKLELHRDKPNCYACHSQMDPLGFSLENFDWFGRYRSKRGRGRIDATGQLPNGTKFKGLGGLKKVILEERKDDLVRQVTQKLLSYALGRQLEYYDEPAIRKIIHNIDQEEYRMGILVREVILSYPFRYKQNPPPMTKAEKPEVPTAAPTE